MRRSPLLIPARTCWRVCCTSTRPSIQKLRIAGLNIAPITAGLFLAFATMLLGRRRV
jgi:hypothetical protein